MKKIYTLLLIITILLAACQPTPEEIAVKQKNGIALMETIKETVEVQEENVVFEAEKNWVETISDETEQFTCIIDASIGIPQIGTFPVIYVTPNRFNVDFIKKAIYQLVPDGINLNIYDGGSMGSYTLTKEQIEEAILSIQETINNPDSFLNKLKEKDTKAYEERLAIEQDALENYRAKYEDAPEKVSVETLIVTDELLKNTFSATNIPPVVSNPEDYLGIPRVILTVADCDADGGVYNKLGISIVKDLEEITKTITIEEAMSISDNYISNLSITDMNISAVIEPSKFNEYYQIYYSRDYEGIPTTYTTNQISINSDAGTYSFPWMSEIIELKLQKNGDLLSFIYTSPLIEENMISNNVALLKFDEIKEIFKKQIVYEGIYIEDDYVIKREYHINNIKLGMMRVAIENEANKYMVIPVWDFFGYFVDTYDSQEHTQWQLDENKQVTQNDDDPYYSVLTINAIDGSIIDRSIGY